MSAIADVKYQLEKFKPTKKMTAEDYARSMLALQTEIYSANVGYDLDSGHNGIRWDNIEEETKKGWLKTARKQAKKFKIKLKE